MTAEPLDLNAIVTAWRCNCHGYVISRRFRNDGWCVFRPDHVRVPGVPFAGIAEIRESHPVLMPVDTDEPTESLLAEVVRLTRDRDLAIAHDRQPYPTADAYEAACRALEKHRRQSEALGAQVEQLTAQRDDLQGQLTAAPDRLARRVRALAAERVAAGAVLPAGSPPTAQSIRDLISSVLDEAMAGGASDGP